MIIVDELAAHSSVIHDDDALHTEIPSHPRPGASVPHNYFKSGQTAAHRDFPDQRRYEALHRLLRWWTCD